MRSGADTYEQKTTDYGSSWRKIGFILSELANGEPIVLDTPEEIIAFGLFTRRMDKIAREFYGTFFADEMNFEGPVDSAEDESVYASMAAENLYDMQDSAAAEAGDEETEDDELHDGVYLMALGYINAFDGDYIYMESVEDKFGDDSSAVLSRLEADGHVRCDYVNFTVEIVRQDDEDQTIDTDLMNDAGTGEVLD